MDINELLRILWLSNAPHTTTAYGIQTGYFTDLIHKDGHTVVIGANYGIDGGPMYSKSGILMLPKGSDIWGNDSVAGHVKFVRADLVITLYDSWVFKPEVFQKQAWCSWSPIDSDPAYNKTIESLNYASYIWVMSHMGEKVLREFGYPEEFTFYVPHGIDLNVYNIQSDVKAAKKAFSILTNRDVTNSFLVCMNGTNRTLPPRKGFLEALLAFKALSDKHSDTLMYLHTEELGELNGVCFPDLAESIGLDYNKLIFPDQYYYRMGMFLEGYMNTMYNAADVFFHTAQNGGFEVPLIEAQACGLNVVYPDAAPFNEIVFSGTGLKTIPEMGWNHTIWRKTDIDSATEALEMAYSKGQASIEDKIEISKKVESFSKEAVYENYMKPALKEMAKELKPKDECKRIWNFERG